MSHSPEQSPPLAPAISEDTSRETTHPLGMVPNAIFFWLFAWLLPETQQAPWRKSGAGSSHH